MSHERRKKDSSVEEQAQSLKEANNRIATAVADIGGVPNTFYFMEVDGSIKPADGYWLLGDFVMNEVGVYLGSNGLEVYKYHPKIQTVGLGVGGIIPMRGARLEVTQEIMTEFEPKAREALMEFKRIAL